MQTSRTPIDHTGHPWLWDALVRKTTNIVHDGGRHPRMMRKLLDLRRVCMDLKTVAAAYPDTGKPIGGDPYPKWHIDVFVPDEGSPHTRASIAIPIERGIITLAQIKRCCNHIHTRADDTYLPIAQSTRVSADWRWHHPEISALHDFHRDFAQVARTYLIANKHTDEVAGFRMEFEIALPTTVQMRCAILSINIAHLMNPIPTR